MTDTSQSYCGRIAPTPTGYLHMGHGRTFSIAADRAREAEGTLLLRVEDIDRARCKSEYMDAVQEDLAWMGIHCDGPPVYQSERMDFYREAWSRLKSAGVIYPCTRSRKDVAAAVVAPHADDPAEPIFPVEWRPADDAAEAYGDPGGVNWRFRVPDGREVHFNDGRVGPCAYVAGVDFGDFLIWRRDNLPAYELAVVVDDAAQGVTEIVRGEDLLMSTARQLLVAEALDVDYPQTYHTELVCDEFGKRLAKRHDALSMRSLRESGVRFSDALKGLDGV